MIGAVVGSILVITKNIIRFTCCVRFVTISAREGEIPWPKTDVIVKCRAKVGILVLFDY